MQIVLKSAPEKRKSGINFFRFRTRILAEWTGLEQVFEEFAVDTSNSLLTSDESERVWIESGLNDQWLNTPIAQIFSK